MKAPQSKPEATLALQLRAVGIYHETQYHWHSERKFRSDFAVWGETTYGGMPIGKPLLVEVDGAKRGKPGAHQRVDGIDYDCRRAAEALCEGYTMFRVSSGMVRDGTALAYIEKFVAWMKAGKFG